MSKVTTSNYIFKKGISSGLPAFRVHIEGEGYTKEDHNNIVSEALKSNYKNVVINGNLTLNPILKETIQGLTSKNIVVSFVTDGTDNIGPIRIFKNIKFILNLTPPTAQQNTINPVNMPLLKFDDELCFLIGDKQDYADAKEFLKGKTVTQPTVIFVILTRDFKNTKDIQDLEEQFLLEAKTFKFKARLQLY